MPKPKRIQFTLEASVASRDTHGKMCTDLTNKRTQTK